MMQEDVRKVLEEFGLAPGSYQVQSFGSGLIHQTFIVKEPDGSPAYILQEVNQEVFRQPEDIAHNLRVLAAFLRAHKPDYLFTAPILTKAGADYARLAGNYVRLFAFVRGTHTIDFCSSPDQAYEAALQFGTFTATLADIRTDMLRYTIPRFHHLGDRWHQFEMALAGGNTNRIRQASDLIRFLQSRKDIVVAFDRAVLHPQVKLRVTHHDTKINNVLFNEQGRGVCVIDLDTVMPGYFFSDLGDMFRTYLSPLNEESDEFDRISVRKDCYAAILQGYLEPMADILTTEEKALLFASGEIMMYMQCLRFLTDYLLNDVYYGARYETHNFVRAQNQAVLLQRYGGMEGLQV